MLKNVLKSGGALILLALPVQAQDSPDQMGLKSIGILQGWRTLDGTHMAAVRFSLEKNWKTYWRAPGGNGIPASFDWTGSENLAAAKLHWPSPRIYVQDGLSSIGYKDEFILPVEFTPVIDGDPIIVRAQVDYGICSDVCIPATSTIEAILNADQERDRNRIEAALAILPLSAKAGGVQSVSCQVDSTDDGVNITASINFENAPPAVEQAVIELAAPDIWIDQTGLQSDGNTLTAQAVLVSFSEAAFVVDQSKLRITLIGQVPAIEINGCPIVPS
jgi:DsbC/DsbD-like thiol-disulfide interchange protein